MDAELPYSRLGPETVLDAVESVGFDCDGAIIPLASYENRVYQVGTENGFVVVKFYRPRRWSDEAILEEHAFALELVERDLAVVPPLTLGGATLHEHAGYRFAVFERRGGRWPELGSSEERVVMGRMIGRIHAVGALQRFEHRPTLSIDALGHESVATVIDSGFVPAHLEDSYSSIAADVLDAVERSFAAAGNSALLRIHGDCHPGNVLWTDRGPHFVDLDDCVNGPAIQDLWLFLSGGRDEMSVQLADLLEGYTQFRDFDFRELHLVEALRTLRIMRYTAWLARRWHDPAFPRAFPWFVESKHWEEHVLALREQRAALDEPPLAVL